VKLSLPSDRFARGIVMLSYYFLCKTVGDKENLRLMNVEVADAHNEGNGVGLRLNSETALPKANGASTSRMRHVQAGLILKTD